MRGLAGRKRNRREMEAGSPAGLLLGEPSGKSARKRLELPRDAEPGSPGAVGGRWGRACAALNGMGEDGGVGEGMGGCGTLKQTPPASVRPLFPVQDPQNLPSAPIADPPMASLPRARLWGAQGEGPGRVGFPGRSLTLLSLAGHQLLASGHSCTPDTPLPGSGRVPAGHHPRPWAGGHGDRARRSRPGASEAPAAGTDRSRLCSCSGCLWCPPLTPCPLPAQEDVAGLRGRLQRMKVSGQVPSVPSGTSSDLRARLERVQQLELRVRQRRAESGATAGDTGVAAPGGHSR